LYLKKLRDRVPSEWLSEWLTHHRILFGRVLTSCGVYRRKDVWFDTIEASEKDYKIPSYRLVPSRLSDLAGNVVRLINELGDNFEAKFKTMAIIHFEFIRIHPFADGNGRIGRMIIDQLCLAFSLPAVMGGYPCANLKQRRAYHEAIKDSCYDTDCTKLTTWIRGKLEEKDKQLI
jgi:Fic family protein